MEIEIRGEEFMLLSQKAVYWKSKKTLLIGDLHLGKITHFRKAGIAAPVAAFENNFTRLTQMLNEHVVERIIFLGDLFHNRYNKEWDRFVSWRQQYQSVEMMLLIGNHDILPADMFRQAKVSLHDHLAEGPFLFYHHPVEAFSVDQFPFLRARASCLLSSFNRQTENETSLFYIGPSSNDPAELWCIHRWI